MARGEALQDQRGTWKEQAAWQGAGGKSLPPVVPGALQAFPHSWPVPSPSLRAVAALDQGLVGGPLPVCHPRGFWTRHPTGPCLRDLPVSLSPYPPLAL